MKKMYVSPIMQVLHTVWKERTCSVSQKDTEPEDEYGPIVKP